MSTEDDALDIFEELSRSRDVQRDGKYQEELKTGTAKTVNIVDTGEECVGG